MKIKVIITTEVESHCQEDAELMAFDNIGLGNYKIETEEIKENEN